MPVFSESFKNQIRARDNYKCLICGISTGTVAHLRHRGIGGDDSKNTEGNCVVLCNQHHAQLDGRQKPRLRIDEFDPNNSILRVSVYENGEWRALNPNYLDFYRRGNV